MEAVNSETMFGAVALAGVIVVLASLFPQFVLPIVGGALFVVGAGFGAAASSGIHEITVVLLILGGLLLIGVGQGIRRLNRLADAVAGPTPSPERRQPIEPGGPDRAGQATPGHGL